MNRQISHHVVCPIAALPVAAAVRAWLVVRRAPKVPAVWRVRQ